jgi:hypothetical protein
MRWRSTGGVGDFQPAGLQLILRREYHPEFTVELPERHGIGGLLGDLLLELRFPPRQALQLAFQPGQLLTGGPQLRSFLRRLGRVGSTGLDGRSAIAPGQVFLNAAG